MIEQQARVIRCQSDMAEVSVGAQSGCTACDAGKGCGAGLFGRLLQRRPVEISVHNGINAVPGQAVILGLPENLYLQLVFGLYGMPLLAGLAGAVVLFQVATGFGYSPLIVDLLTLAGGLASAGLVMRFARKRLGRKLPALPLQMVKAQQSEEMCPSTVVGQKP